MQTESQFAQLFFILVESLSNIFRNVSQLVLRQNVRIAHIDLISALCFGLQKLLVIDFITHVIPLYLVSILSFFFHLWRWIFFFLQLLFILLILLLLLLLIGGLLLVVNLLAIRLLLVLVIKMLDLIEVCAVCLLLDIIVWVVLSYVVILEHHWISFLSVLIVLLSR